MGLKLFADHCVPFSVIQSLRDAGIDVQSLKDHIPPDSPDPVVISKANELNAVLISLNGDFADIVSYPPENYKGISIYCEWEMEEREWVFLRNNFLK